MSLYLEKAQVIELFSIICAFSNFQPTIRPSTKVSMLASY